MHYRFVVNFETLSINLWYVHMYTLQYAKEVLPSFNSILSYYKIMNKTYSIQRRAGLTHLPPPSESRVMFFLIFSICFVTLYNNITIRQTD